MKPPPLLGLSLCFSLAACGSDSSPTTADAAVADLGSPADTGLRADAPATTDVAVAADAPLTDVTVADASADVPGDVAGQGDVVTGRACGGRGGSPCPSGQFCDFPIASACGAADGPGACTTPPVACSDLFDPVCGCDGHTYSNACDAASSGASVASRGACLSSQDAGATDAATADCRSAGCSGGSTCMACLGAGVIVYACIPSGAAC